MGPDAQPGGPGAAFLRDPAAAGRALRRWAWPLKAGLVSAALVAAVPLLLTAVVALGTGLLVFGACRLVVLAGDALGVGGPGLGGPGAGGPRPVGVDPRRSNVRVVRVQRQG